MQPARFKLHAEERTSNPVQRPNCRGHALTMAEEAKVGRNRNHHLILVGHEDSSISTPIIHADY